MSRRGLTHCLELVISLGVVAVSLLGCATAEPKLQKVKLAPLYQQRFTSVHDNNIPDEVEDKKKGHRMTSEELERSGDLQLGKGNLYMAYIQYEKSLRVNPENTRARYKKGLLLIVGRMNLEAIKEFQEVIKRAPGHALAYEGMGKAYFQMKKYDEAVRHFQKALELDPKLWKSHNFLGIIYDYQQQHDMAIREFEEAIGLRPEEGLLYNNLGVSYSLAGRYKEAVEAFNKALDRQYQDSKFYNNLGLVLSKLGRYQEALEAFKKQGDQAQAYNNVGCIYLEEGEFEKAMSFFEKALEVRPTFYSKASDNLENARMGLQRGLGRKLEKGEEESRDSVVNNLPKMELGMFSPISSGQTVGMEEPVDREPSPSQMDSLSEEGLPYLDFGSPATPLWVRRNEAKTYKTLGWRYLEQGESEKAMNYFEKAIETKLAYQPGTGILDDTSPSNVQEPPRDTGVQVQNSGQNDRQGSPPYAQVESPKVEALGDGGAFRLTFKLVNPGQKPLIAGTVAIVASLKDSHDPGFISSPPMELDPEGLPVQLRKDLRFTRIQHFKSISGEFNLPLSSVQSFRILVYNGHDQLVYDHLILPQEVSSNLAFNP